MAIGGEGMKIAQIHLGRVNNALGGTEKVYINMANEMVSRGHEVACFYFDKEQGTPIFPVDERVYLKNCYDSLNTKVRDFVAQIKALFVLERKKRHEVKKSARTNSILENVNKFNPDVIIMYWPNEFLNKLVMLKYPTILMLHSSINFFINEKDFNIYLKGMNSCDSIQVLMPEYVDQLRQFCSNKNIIHIPNIVKQFTKQSKLTSKKIVYVGRMGAQKRVHLVAQAFALIEDKYKDWVVEMWGETHTEPHITKEVQDIISQKRLTDRVLLCGTTTDVPSKLEDASIILMPSAYEGFPLATTEAMSMGLPAVVCKDCPSHNTLVRNGENGYVCEPTPEDIAKHLELLINNYELRSRLGNQAREDMKQYKPELIYDRWEQLMTEVIDRRKGM